MKARIRQKPASDSKDVNPSRSGVDSNTMKGKINTDTNSPRNKTRGRRKRKSDDKQDKHYSEVHAKHIKIDSGTRESCGHGVSDGSNSGNIASKQRTTKPKSSKNVEERDSFGNRECASGKSRKTRIKKGLSEFDELEIKATIKAEQGQNKSIVNRPKQSRMDKIVKKEQGSTDTPHNKFKSHSTEINKPKSAPKRESSSGSKVKTEPTASSSRNKSSSKGNIDRPKQKHKSSENHKTDSKKSTEKAKAAHKNRYDKTKHSNKASPKNQPCSGNQGDIQVKSDSGSTLHKEMSVMDMLMMHEMPGHRSVPVSVQGAGSECMTDSGSESSDWEEVQEAEMDEQVDEEQELKSRIPKDGVEITLDNPSIMRKRKRKTFDLEDWFRRQVNRLKKETQLEAHKVHLLCLFSHGFYLNRILHDETLLAVAYSLIPPQFHRVEARKWGLGTFQNFTKWFASAYSIQVEVEEEHSDWQGVLQRRFQERKLASDKEYVMMFTIFLRSLYCDARFVYSLQPMTRKAQGLELKNPKMKIKSDGENLEEPGSPSKAPTKPKSIKSKSTIDAKRRKSTETKCKRDNSTCSSASKSGTKHSKLQSTKDDNDSSKSKQNAASAKSSAKCSKLQPKNRLKRESASKLSYMESNSGSDDSSDGFVSVGEISDDEDEKRIESTKKKSRGTKKGKSSKTKSGSSQRVKNEDAISISSGGEDFERETTKFRSPSLTKSKSKTKMVSSDSGESVEITKSKVKTKGVDYWVEVFVNSEEKWICIDVIGKEVNQPDKMENKATKPVHYVIAYDNNHCAKDLSKKYCSNWMSGARKLRVDEDWWREVLEPYRGRHKEREEKEDLLLEAQLLKTPLPTAIGEYKKHPLYALKRHLLKFEALYPPSAVPLGFVRGEPVYARDCVRELHSRETWMKDARAVRLGEEPYKMVKARSKRNRTFDTNETPMIPVFGHWQTEDYIPPPAVDGKVPRNGYGNVELFKSSMLPGGTVHLKLPGLNKAAKKLGIDCAPAMVGWDFHSGFNHPIMDGFIVCEEFKDILLAAWDEEQEIIKEREAEKREKRITGNWTKLVKGLLIKERIKVKYNLQEPSEAPKESTKKPKSKAKKHATETLSQSWPLNRQDTEQASTSKTKQKGTLLPFEIEIEQM